MIILGIDTSCDDTCVALLKIRNSTTAHFQWAGSPSPYSRAVAKFEIRSNIVSSQAKLHAKYGGVYPSLAKREHQKNLPIVFKKALRQAQGKLLRKTQGKLIDLIGVTVGPGLEPCLWQGVNFAKDLARKLNSPIIPVNHIEAHILVNTINNQQLAISNFPAVCLVVSGGHTQLILMRGIRQYKLIGETRDDAAGECFDKVARILGLGYPGGPIVAAEAARCKVKGLRFRVRLPRPMIYQKNYDFSFSGLKTAVLYLVKQLTINNKQLTIRQKREICHEVQQAIIDVLIHKTLRAAKDFKVKSIILGGGVVANNELRKQFQSTINNQQLAMNFLVPPKIFCTDNAAMVAVSAYFNQEKAIKNWKKIKVNANLKI